MASQIVYHDLGDGQSVKFVKQVKKVSKGCSLTDVSEKFLESLEKEIIEENKQINSKNVFDFSICKRRLITLIALRRFVNYNAKPQEKKLIIKRNLQQQEIIGQFYPIFLKDQLPTHLYTMLASYYAKRRDIDDFLFKFRKTGLLLYDDQIYWLMIQSSPMLVFQTTD